MKIGRLVCGLVTAMAMLGCPFRTGAVTAAGAVQVAPRSAQAGSTTGGTLVLRGSLPSTVTLTMRGAFSVGHAHDLLWALPRVTGEHLNGYDESVEQQTYRFSVAPDSAQDLTVDGQTVRRFHWTAPPANTVIRVTEHLHLRIGTVLRRFQSAVSYPLQPVPDEATPYLTVTPSLRLSASNQSLARRLARGQTTEQGVVQNVANWVAWNVGYDSSLVGGPYNAEWVMAHHRASCQGYASVMAGMLRSLGIPARVVYGWVSAAPIRVKTAHGEQTMQWGTPGTSGTFHDWLNVYFPGTGWVPFDPQGEKFFVDARHYAFLTEVDAHDPVLGLWSATPVDAGAVTGRTLAPGSTEVVPGDGVYPTAVQFRDSFRFHVSSLVPDAHRVMLFSR